MTKIITRDDYIARANATHKAKYDYSYLPKKVKSTDKVDISCPVHGIFSQRLRTHISGQGCRLCGINSRRKSIDKIISDSVIVHGEKYDYSKALQPKNKSEKIEIVCKHHGSFYMSYDNHINQKQGCRKCYLSADKGMTQQEWFNVATSAHVGRYKYKSLLKDKAGRPGLLVVCRIHGEFVTGASRHVRRLDGCPCCSKITKSRKVKKKYDYWHSKFKSAHGDRYIYYPYSYNDLIKKKVKIKCREHGDFYQDATHHSSGVGCPSCARGGFNSMKESFLYVLTDNCGNIKIGITGNIKKRITNLARSTPFEFDLVATFKGSGADVLSCETTIHRSHEKSGFTGFDGCTEWITPKDLSLLDVPEKMNLSRFVYQKT